MKMLISNYKPCGITELYEAAAKEMGYTDTVEIKFDCTKINVAENIQDGFYECYAKHARETNPNLSDNDIRIGTTMLLAMSGPKVDNSLKVNEVEIFKGFIVDTIQKGKLNDTKAV